MNKEQIKIIEDHIQFIKDCIDHNREIVTDLEKAREILFPYQLNSQIDDLLENTIIEGRDLIAIYEHDLLKEEYELKELIENKIN